MSVEKGREGDGGSGSGGGQEEVTRKHDEVDLDGVQNVLASPPSWSPRPAATRLDELALRRPPQDAHGPPARDALRNFDELDLGRRRSQRHAS